MNKISWSDDLSLGIKEIDDQHKHFIELNNLIVQIDTDKADMLDYINKLADYAKDHFETEERYFDSFECPDIKVHKHEHTKFLKKISKTLNNYYTKDKKRAVNELKRFIGDWLTKHVMEFDQKYAECFKKNGL